MTQAAFCLLVGVVATACTLPTFLFANSAEQVAAQIVPAPAGSPPTPTPRPAAPSVVEVRGAPYQYTYYVNGVPQIVRGIGYNVAYRAAYWSWELRAQQYDRDFALMHQAGFDTIIGWHEDEFDDLTLDKAHQHQLGVILPYFFPPEADWQDPAVRLVHRERVEALVRRYAGHPALRIWGLGNEVIWAIGDAESPRARAFGQFLAELVERVRQLDPNHPIIYREAEDVYLAPIHAALRERGLEQPWMIYGVNSFTFRLQDILSNWPATDFRVPVIVSEFNVMNGPGPERTAGLLRMWDIIRAHRDYVLGGAVYAWTVEGFEQNDTPFNDRVFGLVDGEGKPVDGALPALRERLLASRDSR